MTTPLAINTDHVVTLQALTDQAGNAVTAATVEATLYQQDASTKVSGVTWPVSLSSTGSGNYSGNLSRSLSISLSQLLWLNVVAANGGVQGSFWQQCIVVRG